MTVRIAFGLALIGFIIALVQFGMWFVVIGAFVVGAVIAWEVAAFLYRFFRKHVHLYLDFRAEQRRELSGR